MKVNRVFAAISVVLMMLVLAGSVEISAANKASGSKKIVVTKQSELTKALADKQLTELVISTDDEITLTIAKGSYTNVTVRVNAPFAKINNKAVFAKICVEKATVYNEYSVGNTIDISDEILDLNVMSGAKITRLNVNKPTGLDLKCSGEVTRLYINADADIYVTGSKKASLNFTVKYNAKNAMLTSAIPLKGNMYGDVTLILQKGAEKSSITMKDSKSSLRVKNNTSSKVTVTGADGKKVKVPSKETYYGGKYESININGGYITDSETIIETKYLRFIVCENAYISSDFVEAADIMCESMQKVTGLTFDKGKLFREKIDVVVKRYAGDVSRVGEKYELGEEFTNFSEKRKDDGEKFEQLVWEDSCAPGDLFISGTSLVQEEIAGLLFYENTGYYDYTRTYENITTYYVQQDLEKNYPEIAILFCSTNQHESDFCLRSEYMSKLMEQKLEYWWKRDNISCITDYFVNEENGVRFELYTYLEETYHTFFENAPDILRFKQKTDWSKHGDYEIKAIKKVFGANSLDGFYTWLTQDRRFIDTINNVHIEFGQSPIIDYVYPDSYTIYPLYGCHANSTGNGLGNCIPYNDTLIKLSPTKYYLEEYKKEDISNLYLIVSAGDINIKGYQTSDVDFILYDEYGRDITENSDVRLFYLGNRQYKQIMLKDVASIKLLGEGFTDFCITGYGNENGEGTPDYAANYSHIMELSQYDSSKIYKKITEDCDIDGSKYLNYEHIWKDNSKVAYVGVYSKTLYSSLNECIYDYPKKLTPNGENKYILRTMNGSVFDVYLDYTNNNELFCITVISRDIERDTVGASLFLGSLGYSYLDESIQLRDKYQDEVNKMLKK